MTHCRFVFCRQRQDEKLKRGGEQKSVVVLSHQPYSSTLIPLAQYAGPLYFNNGSGALQEVRHLITVRSAFMPATMPDCICPEVHMRDFTVNSFTHKQLM